jgi:hypothetical protein
MVKSEQRNSPNVTHMPLETRRGGKSYYYRARRVNGRIVRTYVGAGDVALAAAQADADERARLVALRRAVDERQQQISAAIAPARQANDYLDSLSKAILIDAGYYRHDRGKWKLRSRRPRMIKPTTKQDKMPTQEAFKAVVDRANTGDAEALKELRQLLHDNATIWQQLGDLPKFARESMLTAIAGKNQATRESVRLAADSIFGELTTESCSPIVRLGADRVVSCWLVCHFVDMLHPIPQGATVAQKRYHLALKSSAQKRYSESLRSLATLKTLLPSTPPEPEKPKATQTKRKGARTPEPTIKQRDPYNRIAIYNEADELEDVSASVK